jgi:hypothetical protein
MTRSAATPRLPRGKKIAFALTALVSAVLLTSVGLLVVDVYLHRRFERSAGFNVWGYRGPTVGRKKAGEYRVAVLGGSAAFGYGVTSDQAFPARLQDELKARDGSTEFTVVNLAHNNEGAYAFKPTLEDYLWLNYDLVFLYEGYNDLSGDPRGPNVSVFRHESLIFRLTGYLPIFPIVFKEKAAALLNGGDTTALYRAAQKPVFRPGLGARTAADVLTTVAEIGQAVDRQMGLIASEPPHHISDVASTGCRYPWQEYCRSVLVAVEFALQHDKRVIVATQPYAIYVDYLRMRHMEQQREMAAMLQRRFATDPRVRYLNFGNTVDLHDPSLSFDGMHLTAAGNHRVSEALVAPVLEMAAASRPPRDERRP